MSVYKTRDNKYNTYLNLYIYITCVGPNGIPEANKKGPE